MWIIFIACVLVKLWLFEFVQDLELEIWDLLFSVGLPRPVKRVLAKTFC
jgi:hypothetical protein